MVSINRETFLHRIIIIIMPLNQAPRVLNTLSSVLLCAICRDDSTAADHSLSCGHLFHEECITGMMQHAVDTCPTCRASFYEPETEEERLAREAFDLLGQQLVAQWNREAEELHTLELLEYDRAMDEWNTVPDQDYWPGYGPRPLVRLSLRQYGVPQPEAPEEPVRYVHVPAEVGGGDLMPTYRIPALQGIMSAGVPCPFNGCNHPLVALEDLSTHMEAHVQSLAVGQNTIVDELKAEHQAKEEMLRKEHNDRTRDLVNKNKQLEYAVHGLKRKANEFKPPCSCKKFKPNALGDDWLFAEATDCDEIVFEN